MENLLETKKVDTSRANRSVWLVKVPGYLAKAWQESPPESDVATLQITKFSDGRPLDCWLTSKPPIKAEDGATNDIPRKYKFNLMKTENQTLQILATDKIPIPENNESIPTGVITDGYMEGRVSLVGVVNQRGECLPAKEDGVYLSQLRARVAAAAKPKREIQMIDKNVSAVKPIAEHQHDKEQSKKKKLEGKKSREEKEVVMDMLFAAYERHQYYTIRDLVTITKQPTVYVKEILKEICMYNMKAPNKNTWELKPEYRHYKTPKPS